MYDYHLMTDGGCSTVEEQEFLIPIGTKIWHEYGLYKVTDYGDAEGEPTKTMAKIKMVFCDKVYGDPKKQ